MKNKKREITLLIIGILGLVSLMVGATYAYFKAQIGPAAISDITTTTATTDNFTFSTDGEIVLNVTAENLANGQGNVQDSSIAKARLIANNKTNTTTKEYNVYFLIEENDIEYSSYTKDGTTQSFKTTKEKEDFDLTGYEPVPEMVMSVRKNGSVYNSDIKRINKLSDNTYDITEEEGLYLIGENVPITSTKDETDTWEVTITYKNLETNQQLNVGHSLKGKIIITTEKLLYEINNADELRNLSIEVNGGDTKEGKYYVLTNNIDLGTHEDGVSNFTPIGINTNRFKGNLDGDNHVINNLYITGIYNAGLFGYVENAKFNNIIIKGEITNATNAGGLICYSYGETKINKIANFINVRNEQNNGYLGGILGVNYGTLKVRSSKNYGIIKNGNITAGLVGINSDNLIIDKGINYGEITNNLGYVVGGLVGNGAGPTSETIILNSHNEGELKRILGEGHIGGLIGWVQGKIQIDNSFNNNKIITTNNINSADFGGSKIGGLIGYIGNDDANNNLGLNIQNIITNSYNSEKGVLIDGASKGGIIGNLIEAKLEIKNCYNLADIETQFANESDKDSNEGGLVGYVNRNSILKIRKSYNKGNFKYISNLITNLGPRIGGLVGQVNRMSSLEIEESYNLGNIEVKGNSFGLGGIVGSESWGNTNNNVILNKVYNTGNITIDMLKDDVNGYSIGGLIGTGSEKTYILNSYNIGNIEYVDSTATSSNFSGIIGNHGTNGGNQNATEANIINCYNVGNIKSHSIGTGIVHGTSTVGKIFINNVYNIGKVEGTVTYGVFNLRKESNNNINNVYYMNMIAQGGNISEIKTLGMTEDNIKSPTFVEKLNSNIVNENTLKNGDNGETMTLEEIAPELKKYTLVNWKLGEDGYPTLDF